MSVVPRDAAVYQLSNLCEWFLTLFCPSLTTAVVLVASRLATRHRSAQRFDCSRRFFTEAAHVYNMYIR